MGWALVAGVETEVLTEGVGAGGLEGFAVRPIAAHDHGVARGGVLALASHDGDDVDARLKLRIERELQLRLIIGLPVRLVEDLARANEDESVEHPIAVDRLPL